LLRTDGDPIKDGTAQDLGHGIVVFGRVEFQPSALGILLPQSLALQGAPHALANQLPNSPLSGALRGFQGFEVVAPGLFQLFLIPHQELGSEF
jgi:hypothetical protein